MTTDDFLQRCRELAAQKMAAKGLPVHDPTDLSPTGPPGAAPGPNGGSCPPQQELSDAESLIGFFQNFRPDGKDLIGLYDHLDEGDDLSDRLQSVFETAGNARRPQGGNDAFFLVRSPDPLPVEQVEHHAQQWLSGLAAIANSVQDHEAAERLQQPTKLRVLEGIAPKHPRQPEEQSQLLKTPAGMASELTAGIAAVDPHAEFLRPAYYFIACDAMLRDYLMWPFYSRQTGLPDPLKSYFKLWQHGVKYRIFREDQIDLYLPRPRPDTDQPG